MYKDCYQLGATTLIAICTKGGPKTSLGSQMMGCSQPNVYQSHNSHWTLVGDPWTASSTRGLQSLSVPVRWAPQPWSYSKVNRAFIGPESRQSSNLIAWAPAAKWTSFSAFVPLFGERVNLLSHHNCLHSSNSHLTFCQSWPDHLLCVCDLHGLFRLPPFSSLSGVTMA